MFKSKHITIKDLKEDLKSLFVFFVIVNIAGIGIMAFDMYAATMVFVIASVIGVILILVAIAYSGRLSRETMAQMLGKNFMDFCVCKFCEEQRKIQDNQRVL